jgi:hypothetical protein
MSRIEIQGLPSGCRCRPTRQAGGNECLDHGCESGMGGDKRGQDADPPIHAVRVRDVIQLDGLRALPGAYAHADERMSLRGVERVEQAPFVAAGESGAAWPVQVSG